MPRRGRKQPLLLGLVLAVLIWAYYRYTHGPQQSVRPQSAHPGRVDAVDRYLADRATKHLVVATLDGDDTSWIRKRLRGWGTSIYVANNPDAALTVPINKGREAQVYLTFIIDNYDNLPDVMCFIHGRQFQWHNDDPNYDGATVLSQVQIPNILRRGYVNLRCVWVLGCPDEVHVFAPRKDHQSEVNFREGFEELFPDKVMRGEIPEIVGASCCAQFALARWKIHELPRSEYVRIRQWLTDTALPDDISGRILEYSWHMIFGMDPIHCPPARECYCDVFGLCDLPDCAEDACADRYVLPEFSTQPAGWRPLPDYDNVSYEAEWLAAEASAKEKAGRVRAGAGPLGSQ